MTPDATISLPQKSPVREILHGVEVEDTFRWLEDQHSISTRSFIADEQGRFREYIDRCQGIREIILSQVREYLATETVDLPISDRNGGFIYLKRLPNEEQKAVYRSNLSGNEELLVSVDMLGSSPFTSVQVLQVSLSGSYMALGIRSGGEDVQAIQIYDLDTRTLLKDTLGRGYYRGLVFASQSKGFYYVIEDVLGPYSQKRAVRFHAFGAPQGADQEIFAVGTSTDTRLLLVDSEDPDVLGYLVASYRPQPQSQLYLHRAPFNSLPKLVVEVNGAAFGPRICKSSIEAITDYRAPLRRIVSFSDNQANPDEWTEVLPEGEDLLVGYHRWTGGILAHYRHGSVVETHVYSTAHQLLRKQTYPENGTVRLGEPLPDSRLAYLHSDINSPAAIRFVDIPSGQSTEWWKQEVRVSELELEVSKQEYRSNDGCMIPITLVRRKGLSGPQPTLLTAYGSGGATLGPKYSTLMQLLLRWGVLCVIAHVRGGGEGGTSWHEAGRGQRKQTTLNDFTAAAEWLVGEGHTSPGQLGIAGQSYGALLMLCSFTQRPELFRAAIAMGPLADLTRFHLFGVGSGFVEELGSPDLADDFRSLLRLSPYHQIREGISYPSILIISGDSDKRCDALHARKFTAKLREVQDTGSVFLLDYTEERGHKAVLPLNERINALANRASFLARELGISEEEIRGRQW